MGPFLQNDLSRGKDKLGSGLGLAICREIINAHKQTIDVVSTVALVLNLYLLYQKHKERGLFLGWGVSRLSIRLHLITVYMKLRYYNGVIFYLAHKFAAAISHCKGFCTALNLTGIIRYYRIYPFTVKIFDESNA